MGKKLIASIRSVASCSQGSNRWPYFHNAVKFISATVCKNWDRQCANGELLQVRQRSVWGIKSGNVYSDDNLCSYN